MYYTDLISRSTPDLASRAHTIEIMLRHTNETPNWILRFLIVSWWPYWLDEMHSHYQGNDWATQMGQRILEQSPSYRDLCFVKKHIPPLAEQAILMILGQHSPGSFQRQLLTKELRRLRAT